MPEIQIEPPDPKIPEGTNSSEQESLRKEIAEKVSSKEWEWNGQKISDLPSLAKYMLKSNESGKFAPEEMKELLEGILRGLIAERVSGAIPLSAAETVYSTIPTEEIKDIEIVDPATISEKPTKQRLLRDSVEEGLKRWPLKGSYEQEEKADLEAEIPLGYGSNKGGIFYEESVMPDAFLTDMKGFVEVKAYKPFELETWVDHLASGGDLHFFASDEDLKAHRGVFYPHNLGGINLGADILSEIKFIDNLRAGYMDDEELGLEDSIAVLRFPSDSPDELLEKLGIHLHEKAHFQKVIIQKLPFSSEELTTMAIGIFARQMETTNEKGEKLQFSGREIERVIEPLIRQ